MRSLHGTGVAVITPMLPNGKIDFKSFKKLLRHTSKADYWVTLGTTAESATLTRSEKTAILEFVIGNNTKKIPVVCGLGGNNTSEVINELESIDFTGVTAILSVSPYYNKPPQEGIIKHYSLIADKAAVPVILYNVPGRTSSKDRKSTRLNSSHIPLSRMPSSA